MEKRGIRDQLVIATKVGASDQSNLLAPLIRCLFVQFTGQYKRQDTNISHKINYQGNSTKSLHLSVEASLKKLRTTYIDILYVHWWDWTTDVEEVMNSLHALVMQGKVLYLVRHF